MNLIAIASLAIVAKLADIGSTFVAFGYGLKEGNPLALSSIAYVSNNIELGIVLLGVMVIAIQLAVLAAYGKLPKMVQKAAIASIVVLAVATFGIAWHNIWLLAITTTLH